MERSRAEAIALPVARPAFAAQELVWPLLVALSTAAAIAPLWASELLPYQDAPEHVAAVRVLADFHTPGPAFDKWFEIDLRRLEYLGFYLPAAAIAKVFGADAAVRIMLSLIAVATSAAFWMFLGSFGRDRRLAVFAPAVFHTVPLYLGFFNFIESIPLALALVALTERELRSATLRRAAWIAAGGAALLWLHPSGLAFALGAGFVLALTSGESWRKKIRALAPWVPAILLLAFWAVRALAARDGPGAVARTLPRWLGPKDQILGLLRFGNVLAAHGDEIFVVALGALFAAAIAVGPKPRLDRSWRLPVLAALSLVVYLAAPYDMGYMGYIHLRALPFLAFLVIASPSIAPGPATSAILAAVVALHIAFQTSVAAAYRAFDREAQVTELKQVLHAAAPDRRLIALVFSTESHLFQYQSFLHFGAYYEIFRGGRARYNFAETPWTPIRFRHGNEPVALPRSWELRPLELDIPRAVSDEDYVLVRTPGPEPDGFSMVTHAGRWALYAPAARR
jgi:hypothetical protein